MKVDKTLAMCHSKEIADMIVDALLKAAVS